jgi:endo-1,4-beta-xylanase
MELYYNDHSLENAPKRSGAMALVKGLMDKGIPVAGIGTQGHYKMDWPSTQQVEETIREFAALGVKVMVTELDIDVLPQTSPEASPDISFTADRRRELDPYVDGLPDAVQKELAVRYAALFDVFRKNAQHLHRVTFWGVTDRDSWLNNWPVRGRTSHPLLFDRSASPKPSFHEIVRGAESRP